MFFKKMADWFAKLNSCHIELKLALPLEMCLKQLETYPTIPKQYFRFVKPYGLTLTKLDAKHYEFWLRSSIYRSIQLHLISTYAHGYLQNEDENHTRLSLQISAFRWLDFFRWWHILGGIIPVLVFSGLAISIFEIPVFGSVVLMSLALAWCFWFILYQVKLATSMRDQLLQTVCEDFGKLELSTEKSRKIGIQK